MNLEELAEELETDRGVRWMWWAVGVLLALSMATCIAKGADRPADPVVREALSQGIGRVVASETYR